MDPKTLANMSIGGSAAGTGFGVAGDLISGLGKKDMYSYHAGISRMKEDMALQNANFALQTGQGESMRFGLAARHRMGKIIVGQAAGNIDVNKGSAKRVQQGQQYVTDMDNATILDNAARKAYGYRAQAATEEASAEAYDKAADNAMLSTMFNVGSTMMTGGTSVASKWMQAKQSGIYGDDTYWGMPYAPDDL